MLFYFNTSGSAMTSIPSPIYQGSVGVNEILVLAPFPASTTVTASFVLPNGVKLTPRVAQQGDKDDGYTFANVPGFTIGDMNLWRLTLDKALTQYSGDLSVQFSFTDKVGRVLTSGAVTVTVSAGVPSLPVYPSQDDFNIITSYLSQTAGYCQDAEGYSDDALNFKLDAESAASSAAQSQTAAENAARAADDYNLYASISATTAAEAREKAEQEADRAYLQADAAGYTLAQANALLAGVNALVGDLGSALDQIHTYAIFKKGGGV